MGDLRNGIRDTRSNSNRKAVVTGASRGIGAAIACRLGAKGYDLALVCEKNQEALEQVCWRIEADGGSRPLAFCGDVSDPAFVAGFSTAVLAAWGSIDLLVNNAGISYVGLLTDMPLEAWNRVIGVNLTSLYHTAMQFVPGMVRQHSGNIINISSMWGTVGASCEVAYSASKAGVNGFTRALAKELAPSGIRVNAIAPGVIDTDMNAGLAAEEKEALREEIPACRFGTPEDVADAVCAILELDYLTGQVIGVDGGYV